MISECIKSNILKATSHWTFSFADARPCKQTVIPTEEEVRQLVVQAVTEYLDPAVSLCYLHDHGISTVYGQQMLAR
jgi:hypothetical protein